MLVAAKLRSCERTIGLCCWLLINLLLSLNHVGGQLVNTTNVTSAHSISGADSATSTPKPESYNASDITLLSGDEFVDDKEVPTVLFDGLSNEQAAALGDETNRTSAAGADSNRQQTNSSQTTTPSSVGTGLETTRFPTTSTSIAAIASHNETSPPSGGAEEIGEDGVGGADDDEEETDSGSNGNNESASREAAESAFKPPQNVSQYMDYIEKLFHDLRHQITDLFEPHIPQLIRTSQMVELSNACSFDMLRLALALRQFEPWALRMIDSSGKVPEGIFEGSFTALGSYDECLNTVFQSASSHMLSSASQPAAAAAASSSGAGAEQTSASDRQPPTQGKYCLVTLSPFMPPKPPADKVERMFQDEANRRNYTKDDQFSRLSPMFYYMKFRIGVCLPSTCHQGDMDSISSALSSSLRLNITIPDCRVKQTRVPLTSAQFAGGLVFAAVLATVVCATLFDYFKMRWHKIERQETRLRNQLAHEFSPASSKHNQFKIKMQRPHSAAASASNLASSQPLSRFERQLENNWSWMSFSLLTNFRLYFQQNSAASDERRQANEAREGQLEPRAISGHINCLNGIRVLSLCWVIVANSYLTLDPRATKRLSKTREAPRDFLFQLVVQASLAIETFFFLSGLLMSLSFARKLRPTAAAAATTTNSEGEAPRSERWSTAANWLRFYAHRYVRMTPPTMLVIAFSMYAYHLGDGPLWFEATQRVHQSCAQNWWRHLLHVANFIDTRQMCFIHYWYISADMQLFLGAPILMLLLYKCRQLGYALMALAGAASMGLVFYLTYDKNLPPTLLFYNTDPESRREFGNTIMTKPFTHALPYLVGMLVGWSCLVDAKASDACNRKPDGMAPPPPARYDPAGRARVPLAGLAGLLVASIALAELFLPYQWNNSRLPSKMLASIYAALFRLGWSLVLAYIVISCRHKRGRRCSPRPAQSESATTRRCDKLQPFHDTQQAAAAAAAATPSGPAHCFCSTGGNLLNRLLSLNVFGQLSKLAFVAYLIHLPLMSVFIGQTRGLFAFSHTLVIHFAISYLVMTFVLAFLLVHIIEFPFLTLERLMFDKLFAAASLNRSVAAAPAAAEIAKQQTRDEGGAPAGLAGHLSGFPASSPADHARQSGRGASLNSSEFSERL